jgi:hypothetical protein
MAYFILLYARHPCPSECKLKARWLCDMCGYKLTHETRHKVAFFQPPHRTNSLFHKIQVWNIWNCSSSVGNQFFWQEEQNNIWCYHVIRMFKWTFLISNEQFLIRKNTYELFAIFAVKFVKKTVLWCNNIHNDICCSCQYLSKPCFVLLYQDHKEEDITSPLQCCKLHIFTWCHLRRMECAFDTCCETLIS